MHNRLLTDILLTPWAHDFTRGQIALGFLLDRITSGVVAVEPDAEREKSTPAASTEPASGLVYHFASGTVMKYRSMMSESGINLALLDQTVRQFAVSDAHTLILHLDTPGGSAFGVSQSANLIRRVQEDTGKNIVGYTDTMACSAGQWIMAACGQCYMDRHAYVGSIGVYRAYQDLSGLFEQKGIKWHLVTDGKFKAAGHPGIAITEEQLARAEVEVKSLGADFRESIRLFRGDVPAEAMEGQALSAREAMTAGLVDEVVTSLEDVVSMYL
jgi:ClpP class serine protease